MMPDASQPAKQSLLAARAHPFWSIFSILLLFVFSGVAIQILPVAAAGIIADWRLADTALAAPITAILVGSAIGTIVGGIVSDIIGRRPMIAASVALVGIFMGLSSLATAPWHFTATMLFAGLAMGSYFSPGMALVSELSPPHRRALAISLTIGSLPVGLTLASLTAAAILPVLGWQMLFGLAALLAVPSFLLFVWFVPESPGFLASRPDRQDEYSRVLKQLSLPPVEVPEAEGEQPALITRFMQLFRATPVATACLFVLFLATNMFGNAALSWIPLAISNMGFSLAYSSGAMASWTTVTMLATPGAGWLLGKYGLRVVCTASLLCSGVAVALLGAYASVEIGQAAVSAMLALSGLGCAGFVTSVYMLAAESFPAQLRASGIGISDAVGRVGGVLGAYFGVQFLTAGGPSGFFYMLAALMAVSVAFLILLLRATKSQAQGAV